MSVIYIDLAILRKNAGDCRQFGKYTGHREPIKHSSTPGCETQFKQLILNKFQVLDNKLSTIHWYSSQTHTNTHTHKQRGHPFMTSTRNHVFDLPSSLPPSLPPCPHGPDPRFHPRWTSTHGRHEIDTALLKDRMSDFQLQILLKRPNVGHPNCKN